MGRFFKYLVPALLGLSLGFFRVIISEHQVTPADIDYYNGQKMEVIGVVTEVDIRRDQAKYTVSAEGDLQGDILISLNKYPQYSYGDRIRLYGELRAPGEFDGFDYGAYLSRFGIYSVMYHPSIEVLESSQGNFFWHGMSFLQSKFMERINRLFPEPHASFEAGLLVGARKGIPEDLMNKFNITGLTHIIAISGYNITIIIVFVMWMLGSLPRRLGFAVACAAIVLFTLFVGASPAVTRASIMGILGLIALNYGRQNNISLTILWSAALMVAWNPKILLHDVGFQLSFAAVMGLIYVAPHFEKYSKKLPQAFGVREAITMTLAAQVMALPIIVYNFERLSLIAPLANVLVVFAIPPAMLFGFIAVVLSFIFFPLAQIFAYIAWGILTYIIKIIEVTASIPHASINLPGMTLLMMAGYYALLGLILIKLVKSRNS
ncbi:ComEC/Rec2 family competence protein [Candidatus Peregrinibacteria bacterium]|nr:ComEC/Rec2 family competence protein [Candidatus Peregrinibacteria bacterium]